VIPKPPFAWQLTSEREIAAFEALKPRLGALWNTIFPGNEDHYTSVVIPSLTLDRAELQKIDGASHYEERLLFLLIRLRNPKACLVYVTSQPLHPLVVDYYLEFLAGVPASHARDRLTLLSANDSSPRSLTEKILERPRLIERIRAAIPDPSRAYLTVFNSTPLERRLAVLLDLPMNGMDPRLAHLGSKSGSRKVFRAAGVELPDGFEDLHTREDVERALLELRRIRPKLRRAVLKLNEGFSGEGNAVFRYPDDSGREAIHDALERLSFCAPGQTVDSYFDVYAEMGGVAEEFYEDGERASPSVQLRVNPRGQVILISSHDQILGGPNGQVYVGCRFPAGDGYRRLIQEAALRIGAVLAASNVVSRFSVDFIVFRLGADAAWEVRALEINLRMGGTTHPFLALRFLVEGKLDPDTGLFLSPGGGERFYRSTDNLQSENYRGLLPEDLFDILADNRLHYSQAQGRGVLFHLIGALSQYGKVGLTAIGSSRDEAEALYAHTLAVLDAESRRGHPTHD
jgi:PGM1 C-terminal domain